MNRKQTYTVAEHNFSLELDENDLIWKKLARSFSPFENNNITENTLFTLSDCKQLNDLKDTKPLFINPDPNPPGGKINVHQTTTGYLFEMFPFSKETDQSLLLISANGTKAQILLQGNDNERFNRVNTALMLCYLMATIKSRTLLMHASAIINSGTCYIFLGRSGTGKSTHANLWLQHVDGSELLNDDHPIIRIHQNGEVIAYGSPWSGKTPCYRNDSTHLGGIVRIKQAPENHIKRLSFVESYASVMTSCCWGFNWNEELMKEKDITLQELIKKVPSYTLECLPNIDAAILCAENIIKK